MATQLQQVKNEHCQIEKWMSLFSFSCTESQLSGNASCHSTHFRTKCWSLKAPLKCRVAAVWSLQSLLSIISAILSTGHPPILCSQKSISSFDTWMKKKNWDVSYIGNGSFSGWQSGWEGELKKVRCHNLLTIILNIVKLQDCLGLMMMMSISTAHSSTDLNAQCAEGDFIR